MSASSTTDSCSPRQPKKRNVTPPPAPPNSVVTMVNLETIVDLAKTDPVDVVLTFCTHLATNTIPLFMLCNRVNDTPTCVRIMVRATSTVAGEPVVMVHPVRSRDLPSWNPAYDLVYDQGCAFRVRDIVRQHAISMRLVGGGPFSPHTAYTYMTRDTWLANAERVQQWDATHGRPRVDWLEALRVAIPELRVKLPPVEV